MSQSLRQGVSEIVTYGPEDVATNDRKGRGELPYHQCRMRLFRFSESYEHRNYGAFVYCFYGSELSVMHQMRILWAYDMGEEELEVGLDGKKLNLFYRWDYRC